MTPSSRTGRSRLLRVCSVVTACLLAASPAAAVDDTPDSRTPDETLAPLTADEERRLAERFAPILVFHPAEEYFPVSPLFPIESGDADDSASTAERLGTAATRRDRYRALTLAEKAGLATVYYRAGAVRRGATEFIIVEYWLYYVQNTYRVRGNLLPIWAGSSHPNDLEHIHLVLRRTSGSDVIPIEVHASAHHGTMPSNRYRFPAEPVTERLRFLVERGAHALAPDIDGDGLFTAGVDGDSGYKVLWGIRDRGFIWGRHRPSFADSRQAGIVIGPPLGKAPHDSPWSYRLVPVDDLSDAFEQLTLSAAERKALFEDRRHWLTRAFGVDNGSSGRLLRPPGRRNGRPSIAVDRYQATERGVLVGVVVDQRESGVFVGVRHGYLHGRKYLPDLIAEASVTRTPTRGHLAGQVFLSYPLDAATKLMVGTGLVADSMRLVPPQRDWMAGVEVRIGHVRASAMFRSWGPITQSAQEYRLAYFF